MKKTLVLLGLVGLLSGVSLFAQVKTKVDKKPPVKPAAEAQKPKTEPVAILKTKLGDVAIRFFPDKAPLTVKNFLHLCQIGFYNGTKFHRVIPGFMIQGGDPNTKKGDPSTWGTGGYTVNGHEVTVKAEFNDIHHARGIVSMARAQDPNSASSQFFICVADAGYLDHQYTAFGQVIQGMNVVDEIVNAPRDPSNDRPKDPVAIEKALVEHWPVEKVEAASAAEKGK